MFNNKLILPSNVIYSIVYDARGVLLSILVNEEYPMQMEKILDVKIWRPPPHPRRNELLKAIDTYRAKYLHRDKTAYSIRWWISLKRILRRFDLIKLFRDFNTWYPSANIRRYCRYFPFSCATTRFLHISKRQYSFGKSNLSSHCLIARYRDYERRNISCKLHLAKVSLLRDRFDNTVATDSQENARDTSQQIVIRFRISPSGISPKEREHALPAFVNSRLTFCPTVAQLGNILSPFRRAFPFACGFHPVSHSRRRRGSSRSRRDNSFSSGELRAGPIEARRNNSWMREEREPRRGERDGGRGRQAIQIRNFPCGDSVAAGYPFPRNPGSSAPEWGRIAPRDSRRDSGRRARCYPALFIYFCLLQNIKKSDNYLRCLLREIKLYPIPLHSILVPFRKVNVEKTFRDTSSYSYEQTREWITPFNKSIISWVMELIQTDINGHSRLYAENVEHRKSNSRSETGEIAPSRMMKSFAVCIRLGTEILFRRKNI
ncbi:hypothetical protein PUN28_015715 [Cardiocondyla obscurior]|uniref:Uncharacterized protein n=1 Tax=Cardiocondyla obscurior TaxID=286306 RepID=A0AAW2EW42_9HYME